MVAVVLVSAVASGAQADHRTKKPKQPKPGTELTVAELGWPATTTTVELDDAAKVFVEPTSHSHRLGKIAKGTRVAFHTIVAGHSSCRIWLELAPAGTGWMCGRDARPTDQPPFAIAHPGDHPKHRGPVTPSPSTFVGLDLTTTPPPQWPFAWLVAHEPAQPVKLFDRPHGTVVDTAAPRSLVPVWLEQDDYVQVAFFPARWVRKNDARIARPAAPPDGLRENERWIDVDMDQQVLIAYDGLTPVYATLVSTGAHISGTPTGVYRIAGKTARTTMSNPAGTTLSWNVRDVPWAMSFRRYFAMHGVYWHDEFGRKHSHGCVNLAPADARWAWAWTVPAVPDGWTEVKADDGAGTPIRLRTHNKPDPPWLDFEGLPPEPGVKHAPAALTASREARRRRGR